MEPLAAKPVAPDAQPLVPLRDIVGQEAALLQLQRAMDCRRVPHAYLFAGPAGVGRRTTAVALAQTFLCAAPTAISPSPLPAAGAVPFRQACGTCDDCRMMAAGMHPDFHLVYKELARFHPEQNVRDSVMQALGIPVIRHFLIAPAGAAPARGRGKVFVVLEADLMTGEAQNALLKTLEEPPPDMRILLLAQQVEDLLPTTRSRCSLVRFGPLPIPFVVERLTREGCAPEEAAFWAGFTGGSLGQSQRLRARGMYRHKVDLLEQLAALSPAGSAVLSKDLDALSEDLAKAAIAAAKQATGADLSQTLAQRQAVAILVQLVASAYRDAITLAAGVATPLVHADQRPAIEALTRRFSLSQLAQVLEQLNDYEELLWRNLNRSIVWDNFVITCASARPLRLEAP